MRAEHGITNEQYVASLGNTHIHHVQPLFLNGADDESNLHELPASQHLSGHMRLRFQTGVPGPPEGMPLDKRDLYNRSMHPDGTRYELVIEEF
jgi:hypothetical protein